MQTTVNSVRPYIKCELFHICTHELTIPGKYYQYLFLSEGLWYNYNFILILFSIFQMFYNLLLQENTPKTIPYGSFHGKIA